MERHSKTIILLILILVTACATNAPLASISYDSNNSSVLRGISISNNSEEKILADVLYTSKALENTSVSINGTYASTNTDKDSVLNELSVTNEDKTIETSYVGSNDKLIENEIKRIMLEFGEDDEMPQVFLDEVRGYIRLFQSRPQYRKFITASMERSSKYISLTKNVMLKRGIPEDMAYIAFIESGFNPLAQSYAGARGMWQFMPGTARNYGLRVGKNIDERSDPVRSTYAAADYIHDLLAIFGPRSFLLSMAAYNSGEGKIISCLKNIDNPFEERTFWHIRPCLTNETREFPPKIIAATIIGNNPEAFGFPRFEDEKGDYSAPVLVDYKLPEDKAIPAVYTYSAQKNKAEETFTKSIQHRSKQNKTKPVFYIVKKGNSIDSIAEVFGIENSDIRRWNSMKNDKLLAGQKLKIYPKTPIEQITYKVNKGDSIVKISESFKVRPRHIVICNGLKNGWDLNADQTLIFYKEVTEKPLIHIVRKGATITHISAKYNVKVRDIMMWNNLSSSKVHTGQKLKIYQNIHIDA